MRLLPVTALLLALPLLVVRTPDRVPPDPVISLERCRSPVQPLGEVSGTGVVRTVLSPDGRPDTTRIEVGFAKGLSPGGILSIARRQLPACKFRIEPKPRAPLAVLQQIMLDSNGLSIRTIPAEGRPFTPLEITPPVLPTEPVEEGDPILEEKPRTLACQNGPREEIVTTGPMSRGDFEAMQREMQRANTGEATFTFVVDTGGRFVVGSVTVLSSTNPSITQQAVRLYQNCQYAPGRIQGVPVATRRRVGFGSEVRIDGQ
ncbi:MAG: energy transducer TonB [Gemmatimonadetes bacterium]|nr:energy transducer TonB [Gemmatimonadota bacterium]